jgi:hypothetical protein
VRRLGWEAHQGIRVERGEYPGYIPQHPVAAVDVDVVHPASMPLKGPETAVGKSVLIATCRNRLSFVIRTLDDVQMKSAAKNDNLIADLSYLVCYHPRLTTEDGKLVTVIVRVGRVAG